MRARPGAFFRRTLALSRAELLHVIRDRAMLPQLLLVPVIQLLVLSNVATFAIKQTPLYVLDYDRSTTSQGLVQRLGATGLFSVRGVSQSVDAAEDLMLHGQATMVITMPRKFERDLMQNGTAPVQLDVNAEKGSAAGVVQGYVAQIIARYAAELDTTLGRVPRVPPWTPRSSVRPVRGAGTIELRVMNRYNTTQNYKHFMVPGILVSLASMIGTLITAQNVAREREMGTLEQLNVTPIGRAEFITAKLLPFWVLALLMMAIALTVGRIAFDVPVRGSPLLLLAASGVSLLAILGIGLWISTHVETQQQAMFVSFFVLVVYLLISGLFTPIDSMPKWMQLASEVNPVRHFVAIARAILLKGAGLQEILRPLGVLTAMGVVVLTLSIRQYHKRTA
jgi:ABC-2 type transport system permease protein